MRPIELSEIKNIADYELIRPALRPRMIALKDRRRISVGDHLTFLFENRETVLYQIQEMMRIERIVKPEEVAHEVATYNELIPGDGELSAPADRIRSRRRAHRFGWSSCWAWSNISGWKRQGGALRLLLTPGRYHPTASVRCSI